MRMELHFITRNQFQGDKRKLLKKYSRVCLKQPYHVDLQIHATLTQFSHKSEQRSAVSYALDICTYTSPQAYMHVCLRALLLLLHTRQKILPYLG